MSQLSSWPARRLDETVCEDRGASVLAITLSCLEMYQGSLRRSRRRSSTAAEGDFGWNKQRCQRIIVA